jgi:hypothetical protein
VFLAANVQPKSGSTAAYLSLSLNFERETPPGDLRHSKTSVLDSRSIFVLGGFELHCYKMSLIFGSRPLALVGVCVIISNCARNFLRLRHALHFST